MADQPAAEAPKPKFQFKLSASSFVPKAPAAAPSAAPAPAAPVQAPESPASPASPSGERDALLDEKLRESGLVADDEPEVEQLLAKAAISAPKAPAAASSSAAPAKAAVSSSHFDFSGNDEPEGELEGADAAPVEDIVVDSSSALRKHVNIVFIGHVDAGKSTISGHILVLAGKVDARTLEKFERDAKANNREGWHFAYVNDVTDEERAKGKTHETSLAQFETDNKRFSILDAPGHKAYVPSMIGGASQADIGVLVISARRGEFETGFERDGQTREHAVLAKTAGVRQLVVVINKMDDATVAWSKERYDECVGKLTPFLKQVGFNPAKDIFFLPLSGLTGFNLKERVPNAVCPWWDGPSLLEHLDIMPPPERLMDAPVRMPVIDKYKDMGTCVLMGKLESGVFRVGDTLAVYPGRTLVKVVEIIFDTVKLQRAEPGDNIRVRVSGIDEENVHTGFMLSEVKRPVPAVTTFDAQVMILECKSIITAGFAPVMHVHSAMEEVVFTKLIAVLDKKTGKPAKENPMFVKQGDTVLATLETSNPVCCENFKDFDRLGRFMLRSEGKTIGIGVIRKLHGATEAKK